MDAALRRCGPRLVVGPRARGAGRPPAEPITARRVRGGRLARPGRRVLAARPGRSGRADMARLRRTRTASSPAGRGARRQARTTRRTRGRIRQGASNAADPRDRHGHAPWRDPDRTGEGAARPDHSERGVRPTRRRIQPARPGDDAGPDGSLHPHPSRSAPGPATHSDESSQIRRHPLRRYLQGREDRADAGRSELAFLTQPTHLLFGGSRRFVRCRVRPAGAVEQTGCALDREPADRPVGSGARYPRPGRDRATGRPERTRSTSSRCRERPGGHCGGTRRPPGRCGPRQLHHTGGLRLGKARLGVNNTNGKSLSAVSAVSVNFMRLV